MWNPHAVFFTTASRTEILRKTYPNASLFFCVSEGPADKACDEVSIVSNRSLYDAFERIYVWGDNTFDFIESAITENNQGIDVASIRNPQLSPFLKVGHPRLDLSKFLTSQKTGNKLKIGFLGYCLYINWYQNPLVTVLLNYPHHHLNAKYSLDTLCLFIDIMQALDSTDVEFSLRPYPVEPRKPYLKSDLVKSGKLTLDDHIDFASWVAEQDIIIGDLTETYVSMYLKNKPLICIHNLLDRYSKVHLTPQIIKLKSFLTDQAPSTLEELTALCHRYRTDPPQPAPGIKEFLHHLFNTDQQHSSLAMIAQDMVMHLQSHPPHAGNSKISTAACRFLTDILEHFEPDSYSNFSSFKLRKKLISELDPIYNNIINHPANKSLLTVDHQNAADGAATQFSETTEHGK